MDVLLPEAGFLALLLSLGVNVLTPLAVLVGVRQRRRGVTRFTTVGVWMQFILLLLAFAILMFCFLTSDLSVIYVTQYSYNLLLQGLRLAAVWGGYEGLLLPWMLFLSSWSVLFALRYRHDTDTLFSLTLSVLSMITALLLPFVVV